MKVQLRTASRARHIVCPFCESGELVSFGGGFARCDSCAMPLVGSTLETLRDIIGLPDALGTHPCECGHPEMRVLPDGVFHCPACGAEVLGDGYEDRGRVFPGEKGQPLQAYSLTGGSFARLLKRAGLPGKTRFHDLRHTCATLLLCEGVHPKLVQELLGHATISITLNTYSHIIPGMGDQTAKAMEDALS